MPKARQRWPRRATWLLAALVLGGGLLGAQLDQRGVDDPDPAYQRPGFLDARGLPSLAAPVTAAVPTLGERAVVFFTRPDRLDRLLAALMRLARPEITARIVVIVAGPRARAGVGAPSVVVDSGALRRAYQMPVPRDGGPPIGYAIIDRQSRVRYRTLDPEMDRRLTDVQTMVSVTP